MNRLLIIEDDPIIARIYQSRLAKEGYEIEVATDGQSGFYRIHEYRPDAVLLDLMLPKINGVDILKKIRAQAQFQRIPIIVFTNAYVPNMIQESFAAGATQVFNKATLTPRQIVDALQNAFALLGNSPPRAATPAPPDAGPAAAGDTGFQTSIAQSFSNAPFHEGAPSAGPAAGTAAPPPGAVASFPSPRVLPNSGTTSTVPSPAIRLAAETARMNDDEFQADLLHSFLQAAPDTLAGLRKSLQDFSKAQDETSRQPPLLELFRKVHTLTGSAGIAGLHAVSKMAAALEVLLKDLYDKPKNLNTSTLRTVANSIDFISELFKKGLDPSWDSAEPVNILVVDDELLSRRAITYALEKTGLKSVSVEDPQVALNLATETTFNLIFLDVQMEGMDGFDLCTRIRALPTNRTTPVIFVTSLTDFRSRARSTLSGGTDLIAKPFTFIELGVKALTYVLRGQLAKRHEVRRAA